MTPLLVHCDCPFLNKHLLSITTNYDLSNSRCFSIVNTVWIFESTHPFNSEDPAMKCIPVNVKLKRASIQMELWQNQP
ncbi:MAG: hypothetical protein ACTSWN_03915 [Promethearchaeota archaeon]